jgi:stage II sporulation protein R
MKKKKFGALYILILSIGTIVSLYMPKNEAIANNEMVVIPDEAIRLRILANSDSEKDQSVKRKVRDVVNQEISTWVADLKSVDEARTLIQTRLPEIQKLAEAVLEKENMNQRVKSEFGQIEFPTKLYGEFLYPAGEYEGILITIGEGKGANWWCVLFPPLCFLDFSNGVAVSDGFDEEKDQAEDTTKNKEVSSEKTTTNEEQDPLFVEGEEEQEQVKVKFFILEVFQKLFD